jgi:ABC-type dipeptide/oligopeptide/nickel transport system permease component
MGRTSYLIKRLFYAAITVFVAITFNFVLFRWMPGDAVANLSRVPHASAKLQAELRAQFGIDKPRWEQYLLYLKGLFTGNWGISFVTQEPVTTVLWRAFRNTIPMVTLGTFLSIVFVVISGIFSAWRRGTVSEKVNQISAMAFYSLPVQWLALMLLFIFSATLGWLPSSGMSNPYLNDPNLGTSASQLVQIEDVLRHMILPAATLALVLYGEYTLLVRSALLETMGEDYILTAKAKGLKSRTIMVRHAFRNATLPVITLVALSLGSIAAGAILVETVFSWPGIGLLSYNAVHQRDYPVLQGAFLIITISVIIFNLIADLLYFKLDPRIVE